MRFFSSESFGFTFLFSSNIHLYSSRCWSAGIGSRCTMGVGAVVLVTGVVIVAAAVVGEGVSLAPSCSSVVLVSFFVVLIKT